MWRHRRQQNNLQYILDLDPQSSESERYSFCHCLWNPIWEEKNLPGSVTEIVSDTNNLNMFLPQNLDDL